MPIIGATRDGNASDKTLNNELLGGICRHMARHGIDPGAFIYVADSALITHDNLKRAEENGIHFLSRLPATFNECARAIDQAVAADNWTDVGALAQSPATGKRPAARYRVFETPVTLYGTAYRAIVVHSSAHDKRRHKPISLGLANFSRNPLFYQPWVWRQSCPGMKCRFACAVGGIPTTAFSCEKSGR